MQAEERYLLLALYLPLCYYSAMNMPDNDTSVAMLIGAIQEVKRGLKGELGGLITPDALASNGTVREWLESLRNDIELFLK